MSNSHIIRNSLKMLFSDGCRLFSPVTVPLLFKPLPYCCGSFKASLIIPRGEIPEVELLRQRERIFPRLLTHYSWL